MRLLFLGGGRCQINGLRRLRAEGHEILLCDYYEDPPGKAFSSEHVVMSTFDLEGNLQFARNRKVEAVVTMGTDQPVRTMVHVAESLGLPRAIDASTALEVTHKAHMKNRFNEAKIPTVPFLLVDKDTREEEVPFSLPWVIKPLDAQGQRGVYRIDDLEDFNKSLQDSFRFTKEKHLLLEKYYPSKEVTITGWVHQGQTQVLTITDRVTTTSGRSIGICTEHRYPSRSAKGSEEELLALSERITEAFGIASGPIYYQILLGDEGPLVNEIACRLGGAYEDVFVPRVTGVDLLGLLFDLQLHGKSQVPVVKRKNRFVSVQLLFARSGTIEAVERRATAGVLFQEWFVGVGDRLGTFDNATYRVGVAVIEAESADELDACIDAFFQNNTLLSSGRNLLIGGESGGS